MPNAALFIELKAKPGREEAVASFLADQRSVVAIESGNLMWVVLRFDTRSFAVLDVFDDTAARRAHFNGNVMKALKERAPDLLDGEPVIRSADVTAGYTRA